MEKNVFVLAYDQSGMLLEKKSTLPGWWSICEKKKMNHFPETTKEEIQGKLNRLQNGFFFKVLIESESDSEKFYHVQFNHRY